MEVCVCALPPSPQKRKYSQYRSRKAALVNDIEHHLHGIVHVLSIWQTWDLKAKAQPFQKHRWRVFSAALTFQLIWVPQNSKVCAVVALAKSAKTVRHRPDDTERRLFPATLIQTVFYRLTGGGFVFNRLKEETDDAADCQGDVCLPMQMNEKTSFRKAERRT